MQEAEKIHNPIASHYLYKEDNDSNACFLYKDALQINIEGRHHQYLINDIQELSISRKRLMLPLLLGGIITPFSLGMYFADKISPTNFLFILLPALLLLYFGWTGRPSISITLIRKQHFSLLLKKVKPGLYDFIFYTLNYIQEYRTGQKNSQTLYFLTLSPKAWEGMHQDANIYFTNKQEPIYRLNQITQEQTVLLNQTVLIIDPINSDATIQHKEGEISISSPINREAILQAQTLFSDADVSDFLQHFE